MSDPNGPNPYGQNPGQPNPYGQNNPYGGGAYQGGPDSMPPKTDGLSIAALVLSFLCCIAPIGVILGIVGLKRTKGGQRKGRGLAIAAIIVGIVMSLASAGVLGAVVFFADKVVTPGNAEVGQCVDVNEEDGSVFLYKKDCTEKHDAEIVGIAEVTDDNRDQIESDVSGHCASIVSDTDLAKLDEFSDDLEYNAVIEDPKDISNGDHLVCYVESPTKLDESIL